METLFTKIANGQIPSTKLYEDDLCFVIMDINPVKKGHSLVYATNCSLCRRLGKGLTSPSPYRRR